MLSEVRTLLWLQMRLTRSMFRARRTSDRLRILGLVWRVMTLLFTLPLFAIMGAGLAVGLALLSPTAAYELAVLVNSGMFLIWLLLPASYSSQLVERFEMSRLFHYPIQFRSIVVGSTLTSLVTMTGAWTGLILLGEVLGLAWHQPWALPLILIGALPTYALLVLTGRIMEDFFDMVAADRRLRALMVGLLSLPFLACWLGQYVLQYVTNNYDRLPPFARIPFLRGLETIGQARGPNDFLETLRASSLLTWLPPGWTTAGMGLAIPGQWLQQLGFLGLSVAFVGLLLLAHAAITRRLMTGAALSIGTERVRVRRWRLRLPGPRALWALFDKDWIYLRRSPVPRRLVLSAGMAMVAMAIPLLSKPPSQLAEGPPLISGAFAVTIIGMVLNIGLTANYFGAIDREGLATMALSAIDRRYILLSANLAMFVFSGILYLGAASLIALLTRRWLVLPFSLYLGLCTQVGGTPAYNLASIIAPYRARFRFARGRERASLWGLAAWSVSALPVLALVVLPYLFWKRGLVLTMPLGVVYSLGLYLFTLKPLGRLLQQREYVVLENVATED